MWQKICDWWDELWWRWMIRRAQPKTPEEVAAREKRRRELLGESGELHYLRQQKTKPEAELLSLYNYLAHHPESKNAKRRCLVLLRELRRDDEALSLCEANLGDFPAHEYPLRLTKAALYLRNGQGDAARDLLQKAQENRGFKRKSSEEFLLEAELEALEGKRETAARLLKRALWSTPDDGARPIQEKVGQLRQRYGL